MTKEIKDKKRNHEKETPIDKLAGIVRIKENVSKHFLKKENGYTYVAGTCP